MREGHLGALEYLARAGALLRAVHSIEPPRYGRLGDGRGTKDDYVGRVLGRELKDLAGELAGAPGVGREVCARATARGEGVLSRFERRLRPSLLHADATPKNAILAESGRLVLVDWDEACAGPWLRDYTHLTYWYSYMLPRGGLEVRDKEEVRAAFFGSYGAPEFDDRELDALENAMHTVEALGVLAFHFRRGDAEGFAHARRLLARLLDALPSI